jgi:hypothetical protein
MKYRFTGKALIRGMLMTGLQVLLAFSGILKQGNLVVPLAHVFCGDSLYKDVVPVIFGYVAELN